MADHIHDTFIAANSWAINSWNWLMGEIGLGGSTLVDIVNRIWSLSANAVQLVKDAVETVVNAVKAGLEYLATAVLGAITSMIAGLGNLITEGIFRTLSTLLGLQYDEINGHSAINQNGNMFELGFEATSTDLSIVIGELTISMSDLLIGPSFETLGLGATYLSAFAAVATQSLMGLFYNKIKQMIITSPDKASIAMLVAIMATTLIEAIPYLALNSADKIKYAQFMSSFHLGGAIGSIIGIIISSTGDHTILGSFGRVIMDGIFEGYGSSAGLWKIIGSILTLLGVLGANNVNSNLNMALIFNQLSDATPIHWIEFLLFFVLGVAVGMFQSNKIMSNVPHRDVDDQLDEYAYLDGEAKKVANKVDIAIELERWGEVRSLENNLVEILEARSKPAQEVNDQRNKDVFLAIGYAWINTWHHLILMTGFAALSDQ